MNKMKKLLSVLLAVIMILSSMSVMASAATTAYKTVDDLTTLNAYSTYGGVTKLTTEARMSMVFDQLDILLGKMNIDLGNGKALVDILGITIYLDLRSVDRLLYSIDSFYGSTTGTSAITWGIAKGILNLGVIEDLDFSGWPEDMTREGTAQLEIVYQILQLLNSNKGVFYDILDGSTLTESLGSLPSMAGLDVSAIDPIVSDLPGFVKGLVFGLFERWDDTASEITALETAKTGDGNVESTIVKYVKDLFTNDMSISTVKLDANGNITSAHNLPGDGDDARVRYIKNGNILTANTYATQKHVDAQAALGNNIAVGDYIVTAVYVLEQEAGTEDYIWAQVNVDEEGNIKKNADGTYDYIGQNLKYYENDTPFLPSLKDAGVTIDLSTMSAADLLYTFIPYVFNEMAPVVLNGSLKKILGGFFGATYKYVGKVVDGAYVADEAAATINYVVPEADLADAFFTEAQGEYLWEWSNYKVINDNHYYRFEDQIFMADLSNVNNYFSIINWNYNIGAGFMDEFVPENGGSTSDTLLMNLNDFLVKVAETVLVESSTYTDSVGFESTFERPDFVTGSNDNLVANIKALAQEIISVAPQHIFGSDYATNSYYSLLMSDNNQTILTGIAATIVDLVMPQMLLPTAENLENQNTTVGAILAAVVRELASQLTPETNYDALIYSDYNTKTFVADKNNEYWLDVIMTMAVDIGVYYLHQIVDFGGDTDYLVGLGWGYGKTYTAAEADQASLEAYWEGIAGYVANLFFSDNDGSYTWNASIMFNVGDNTSDVWAVLGNLLKNHLPIDNILNVDTSDTYWLETALRDNFILSLVNLEWTNILNLFVVPDGYLRTDNVLDQLALALKGIINGLFAKVGGGSYALLPDAMTDLDTLAVQVNIATLVRDLIGTLETAQNNGLLRFVLPIVNLLIGWKVTAQTYADPVISFSYENSMSYLYTGDGDTTATATMSIINNSSGMLLKHRTSDKSDSAYVMTVTSVTSSDATVSVTSGLNTGIHPGLSGDIVFNVAYTTDKAVTLKIEYEFTGKSGAAIGGTQVMYVQQYISNSYADGSVWTAEESQSGSYGGFLGIGATNLAVKRSGYFPYLFVNDLAAVEKFGITFTNTEADKNMYVSAATHGTDTTAPIGMISTSNYVHGSSENSALLPEGAIKHSEAEDTDKSNSWTLLPYTFDEEADYTPVSGTKFTLGDVSVTWRDSKGSKTFTFSVADPELYYYDLTPLTDVYNGMADIQQEDFNVSDSVWNSFKTARDAAVALIMGPMMRSTFTTNYAASNIQTVADNLQAAYDALIEAEEAVTGSAVETADTSVVIENLDKDDDAYGVEINFQDYVLYEYFKYEDVRTLARNILKEYTQPTLIDEYYIASSGISLDELDNDVIANESNEYIAAGIEASKSQRTWEEMKASQDAVDAWVAPAYTSLYLDDIADKLDWYRGFIEQDAVEKQFLAKEIAYADAQNYVEANYTADSWAKYADAYDYAVEVNSGTTGVYTLQSVAFEAKYNLMVAEKNLLKKSESLIEAGGTATLLNNMATANEIFAGLVDGTWAVKEGVDADAAYAALISTLGYNYTGRDGVEYNLYADSAIEYATFDRPNTTSNQSRVNASNAALEAAIANFEAVALEPNTILVKEDFDFASDVVIDTEVIGVYLDWYGEDYVSAEEQEATGLIYGIEVLDYYLTDALTTTLGDDYLVVTQMEAADGYDSTGAKVEVLDADGVTVVETYYFVYFGDLNGDGLIDPTDTTELSNLAATGDPMPTLVQYIASDVNGDTVTDPLDITVLVEVSAAGDVLPQGEIAATFYDEYQAQL